MALHGLSHITIGVPEIKPVASFYERFGLADLGNSRFATTDGGEQLSIVERPYRQLVTAVIAADDADDVARVAYQAEQSDLKVTTAESGQSATVIDPISGTEFAVAVTDRIEQPVRSSPEMNGPGRTTRHNDRSPAIFAEGPTAPRRLGHVLMGTPDIDASIRFFVEVLGFKLSDSVPGAIAFLRCSSDHHNVGLAQGPISFLHHSSWQVDDVDAIGQGGQNLLTHDPDSSVWGIGRHFLGSNLFWYFRDPAGNFAEYFTDLDQIPEDAEWDARTWSPEKALYAWGPPVPSAFVQPPDIDDLIGAVGT